MVKYSCQLNNIKFKMIFQIVIFLQKYSQKYNHLQPSDASGFWHGGHNSESSNIFYYKEYILFLIGLTLRHIYNNTSKYKNHFTA